MSDYLNYFDDSYVNASVLFIVLGAIVLILGFFGCCGACTENSCMMFTLATLLALVVIAEVMSCNYPLPYLVSISALGRKCYKSSPGLRMSDTSRS